MGSLTKNLSTWASAADSPYDDAAWGNPGNAAASDNVYATSGQFPEGYTEMLQGTGNTLAVPASATITGVYGLIEWKNTGDEDEPGSTLKLIVDGALSNGYEGTFGPPAVEAVETIGGVLADWGDVELTPAQVNASNFGLALGVQASAGVEQINVFVDQIRVRVDYSMPDPTGAITFIKDVIDTNTGRTRVLADATDLVPPTGVTIASYSWDWGDSITTVDDALATHTYAAAGTYTVTLTVTYSDGSTGTATQEITLATLTKCKPLRGIIQDTVLTITGTGLGDAQGTQVVKIGGVAVTDEAAWSATSFTCKIGTATPLGAQDIVLYDAEGGNVLATLYDGVYVYDATDAADLDNVEMGRTDAVYIDGLHVGNCENAFKCTPAVDYYKYKNNRSYVTQKHLIRDMSATLTFELSEITGANMAAAMGGEWDNTNKILTISGTNMTTEHSVAMYDEQGRLHVFPRCVIQNPAELNWSPEQNPVLAPVFDLLAIQGTTQFFRVEFPA